MSFFSQLYLVFHAEKRPSITNRGRTEILRSFMRSPKKIIPSSHLFAAFSSPSSTFRLHFSALWRRLQTVFLLLLRSTSNTELSPRLSRCLPSQSIKPSPAASSSITRSPIFHPITSSNQQSSSSSGHEEPVLPPGLGPGPRRQDHLLPAARGGGALLLRRGLLLRQGGLLWRLELWRRVRRRRRVCQAAQVLLLRRDPLQGALRGVLREAVHHHAQGVLQGCQGQELQRRRLLQAGAEVLRRDRAALLPQGGRQAGDRPAASHRAEVPQEARYINNIFRVITTRS